MSMTDIPVDIRGFKGVNLREPAGMIQDDELSSCINFDIGRAGELVKRTGFTIMHNGQTAGSNPTKLIGHLLTSTHSKIIIQAGTKIYYSENGSDLVEIGTFSVEFGVQYANKFYMVRKSGTVLEYDGVTVTAITGSPSGTFCTVYKDRLFVLSSEGANSSRLYFSSVANFSATGWPSTNFIDVRPGDGDFLTCCAVIHDILIVFKGRTTWALYVQGSPENWILRNQNPEIGCISKYTPREIEGFLFFVGARGVYKTDGNIFEDIAENIKPVFEDRIVNITNANIDTAAWWDDKYKLLFNPTPSTQRYFIYHLRTGGWTEWEIAGGLQPATFLEINTASPEKGLYAGDLTSTGKIYRFGGGAYTDAGINYTCVAETKEFDFSLPSRMKRGKLIYVDSSGQGSVEGISFIDTVEEAANQFAGLARRALHKLTGPGFFRIWKFKFAITSDGPFVLYGVTLYVQKGRSVVHQGF